MKHDSPDLPAAPVLGERYEIDHRLREEPWGAVWLARDRLLGAEVGLKVLPREAPEWPAAQKYYEQEAAQALRLRHPDILGVYHLERIANCLFLVQEPFDGESLLEQFARQQRFGLTPALSLLERICLVITLAHQQGVVHWALNPLNLLLKDQEVRLANFAFPGEDGGQVITLELRAYEAPEVIYGDAPTIASNVFSLGVLGYRLVAGSLPYPLTFDEPFPYRLENLPVDLDEIPVPLQNLLLRCLAVDPEERFHDVATMLGQLRQARELQRNGRPSDYQVWEPVEARPAWKTAAAWTGAVLGKIWEWSKPAARWVMDLALRAGGAMLATPQRQLIVLGLACLVTLVIMVGLWLKSPAPELAGTATLARSNLPPAVGGGPPMTETGESAAFQPAKVKPASGPAAAPEAAGAREERYMVVAATYNQQKPAQTLQKRLKQHKIKARIVSRTSSGKTLYQVQVGPVTGVKAADDLAQRLKSKEKITPRVIKMTAKTKTATRTATRKPSR